MVIVLFFFFKDDSFVFKKIILLKNIYFSQIFKYLKEVMQLRDSNKFLLIPIAVIFLVSDVEDIGL